VTTFTESSDELLDSDGLPGGEEPGSGESPSLRPRALIVTIYGLYAREYDGWLSVAALIRLMATLGVDEPAVRSSISRLKRRGLLDPHRPAGAAGYALSASGRRMLAEGDRRLFGRASPSGPAAPAAGEPVAGESAARERATGGQPAGGWVLAVFSVPEAERKQRHALRSRLSWLGFGTVSAGVWIAPGHLAAETREVLAADGLAGYVALFQAGYLAFGDIASQVGRWWDLDRLQHMYQDFCRTFAPWLSVWDNGEATSGSLAGEPLAMRDTASEPAATGPPAGEPPAMAAAAGDPTGDAAAFAAYVRVLTDWRRLPFLDPGLPADLLPVPWQGRVAAELFAALAARLAPAAERYVRAVVAGEPVVR